MANYWFSFGAPSSASLSPTFITFVNTAGTTFAAPAIAEKPPGSGLYTTSYGATVSMAFALDGATTGLASAQRYIYGVFDPQDNMSSTLTVIGGTLNAIGTTLAGMGNTLSGLGVSSAAFGVSFLNLAALIGSTQSSFGSTSSDPQTVFGFLRRAQEIAEGNRSYTKSSGVLDFYSRGSSTLLIEKVITDNTAGTTCV